METETAVHAFAGIGAVSSIGSIIWLARLILSVAAARREAKAAEREDLLAQLHEINERLGVAPEGPAGANLR